MEEKKAKKEMPEKRKECTGENDTEAAVRSQDHKTITYTLTLKIKQRQSQVKLLRMFVFIFAFLRAFVGTLVIFTRYGSKK